MGRPRASALGPILKSEAQARVLAAIYFARGDEPTNLSLLAQQTFVPYSVVQREVDRLEKAGLVTSIRFAGSRVVRANERHPLFRELRALLFKAYGPQYALAELLADEPGIREAFVFGSWAARFHGDWSGEWNDVDVALIGSVTPRRREELEAAAEDLLGWPVQMVVIPPVAWDEAKEPFVETVKSRPLVPIGA